MEIMIRTEKEFRDSYVTLEIKADRDEVVEVYRRLLGPVEGRARVQELEAEVPKLEAGLQTLRNEIEELNADRALMQARIDRQVDQKRALDIQVRKLRQDAADFRSKLTGIESMVWLRPGVGAALVTPNSISDVERHHRTLAKVVRDVQEIVRGA